MAIGVAIAAPAIAQTTGTSPAEAPPATEDVSPGSGLTEVVVTARRRSEPLQDVPVAVTAVGAEAMKTAGIDRIAELPKLAPSLTFVEVTFSHEVADAMHGAVVRATKPAP